jgi:hypothetical protein
MDMYMKIYNIFKKTQESCIIQFAHRSRNHIGCFAWYSLGTKETYFEHFVTTHFLYGFLDMWRRVCDGNVQLKVDNILNFHYVMKLAQI